MHDNDFELVKRDPRPDGSTVYTVRIKALNIEREYLHDPARDHIEITGTERRILVGTHDMTSITGKRVREWLRTRVVG